MFFRALSFGVGISDITSKQTMYVLTEVQDLSWLKLQAVYRFGANLTRTKFLKDKGT